MSKLFNRVKMTVSGTPGTGTVTLLAAFSNFFLTFAESGVANTNVVSYVIEDGSDFEIGIGTYTSAGTTLSRDTVRISKIGGTSGTTKLTLTSAAVVRIDAHKEDIGNVGETNTWSAQQTFSTVPVITGSTTNDSAAAGKVGEHLTATLGSGAATALTNGTAKTVISVSLTAGDWDVTATGIISGNIATVLGHIYASISSTDNTLDLSEGKYSNQVPRSDAFATSGLTPTANVGPYRISLASTTTIYLVLLVGFTVNSCSGYGNIHARRAR